MKTIPRHLLFSTALACLVTLTPAAFAADAAPPAAEKSPAVAPADSPAVATTSTTATASVTAPTPAENSTAADAAGAATTTPSASATVSLRSLEAAPSASVAPTAEPAPVAPKAPRARGGRRNGQNERVAIFGNATLERGQSADAVVAVLGNATSDGEVGDAVVAVIGNARATGPVRDAVVAVLGNVYVDSKVNEVTAVFGNVELGPNAEVMSNVNCVGGVVKRDPKAIVHGDIPNVQFAPFGSGSFDGLHAYISQCVLKGRLLGFGADLGWAWAIALGFLVFYVLLALLFRGGVEKTLTTLETRPGGSILAALLTLLLTPVLIVLLCVTVVGVAVVPFVVVGLACASLFGKATMFAWMGRRITRLFATEGPLAHPAFAVLIGGVIALLLYTVPVLGFIVYKVLGFVGLGVVVYTILLVSKRPKPPAAARPVSPITPPPVSPSTPVAPVAPIVPEAAPTSYGFAAEGVAGMGATAAAVAEPPIAMAAPVASAAALPHAGFWIRTGALLIDLVLVAIVVAFISNLFPHRWHVGGPGALLPLVAIYGAVLWKIRGTTIGGIICGLRVVRVDDRPLDWATCIVRALSCFLSLVVVGLGFIWTAIDAEKQSWHDKIAGTTVVYARGAQSLI